MPDTVQIVDAKDGMYAHRYLAVAAAGASVETVDLTAAALRAAPAGVNTPFDPLGSSCLKLRAFMGAATGQTVNNETMQLTIVGVPRPTGVEANQPKARTLMIVNCVAGSDKTQNVNPISGATAAATDFYEVDTITIVGAYTHYSVLDGTDDGTGGQNKQAVLEFDPLGMMVKVLATAISATFDDVTTPRIDVGLER